MRALMEFDVAGNVPAGATINSVTLTGWVGLTYPGTPGTLNVQLHKALADWGEGTSNGTGRMPGIPWDRATTGDATWLQTFYDSNTALNKWATPGGDFSPTVSGVKGFGADGTSATWTSNAQLVADVQGWLNDPTTNFGWLLKSDEIQDMGIYIESSESPNLTHRPTLTIDYTAAATAPNVSISDVTLAEGNVGTATASFDVTLSAASTQTVTVNYATANGTATAGTDYPTTSGTLTFAPGQTLKPVTVPVNGDTLVELNETFNVNLTGAQNANLLDSQGVATITNDDSASLSINDVTLAEGNAGTTSFAFTVTLGAAVDAPVSVDFSTANGTATTADNDYAAASGTLSFTGNAGETKSVTVLVNGDLKVEPNETFQVNLTDLAAGGRNVTMADSQGAGTITNDDASAASTLAIAATDATKAEGNSGSTPFTFTVTRSGDTSGVSTVSYAVTGSSASAASDADFAGGTLPIGNVTFNATETSKVLTINVAGDTTVEPNEGFTVTLSSPVGATLSTATAAGTITNDDASAVPTLAISATAATKAEGNSGSTPFTFTVTRSGDTSGVSTVNYAVTGSGASAASAADFAGGTLPSGSVTLNATETSKVVTINVAGDTTVESNEGFTVTLSSPVGASITTATATGTITNDDDPAVAATISISDVELAEGNDGTTRFTFAVTLNSATAGPVSVDFATADGTATAGRTGGDEDDEEDEDGGEREEREDGEEDRDEDGQDGDGGQDDSGGDYTAASGVLHFAGNAGETQTITVSVRGDTEVEPDESFSVNLSNAVGAMIADSQGTGTILNDERPAPGSFLRDGVLQVIGTDQNDRVSVRTTSRGELQVSANFVKGSNGQRFKLADVKRIDIQLFGGNDSAAIDRKVQVPVMIDGGAGNDTLRGGSGQTILRGGEGRDQLLGGSGYSILVGEGGNDGLKAGSARSILIGGEGQDNLRGSSSDGILIGGRTDYDANDVALLAILAEWTSTRPSATRITNLTAGVGPSRAYRLRGGETVFDDLARDTLSGRSDRDWFLSSPGDKVTDRTRSDR